MDAMNVIVSAVVGVMVIFGLAGLALLQSRVKENDLTPGPLTHAIGVVQVLMVAAGFALIGIGVVTQVLTYSYTGGALLFLALMAQYARFATWISGE